MRPGAISRSRASKRATSVPFTVSGAPIWAMRPFRIRRSFRSADPDCGATTRPPLMSRWSRPLIGSAPRDGERSSDGRSPTGQRTRAPRAGRQNRETARPPRTARAGRDAAMQADRHHARMPRPLGIENAQRRGQMVVEVVGCSELGGRQPIVVVGKAVRNDQMRAITDLDPIGPVIGIIVGIVEEAAMLHEQRAGVPAWRVTALPAERGPARGPFDAGDGPRNDLPLLVPPQLGVPDETIAVAAEIEAGIPDRVGNRRIAPQRLGAGIDGERDAAFGHQIGDAPEADTRAVFEQRFSNEITGAGRDFPRDGVGQRGLGRRVAVRYRRLRAFLDIEDNDDRKPGIVRPARSRRRPAVADEISLVMRLHCARGTPANASPIVAAKSSSRSSPRGPAMNDRPTGQPSIVTAGMLICGKRHRLATQVSASVFSRNSTWADTGASRCGGRSWAVGRIRTPSWPSSEISRSASVSRFTTAAANFSGSTCEESSMRSATAWLSRRPGVLPQAPS